MTMHYVKVFLVGLSLMTPSLALGVKNGAEANQLEALNIKQEPSSADWRYFIRSSEETRANLWTYHEKSGRQLSSWAWGWRLAWVRTCTRSHREYCSSIFEQALSDKAMVVRAEAASAIGRRYEKSESSEAIQLLAKAYGNTRNFRQGKPLYVQNRILYAIYQIGGKAALKTASKLASRHPTSKTYWQKLSRT